MLLGSKITLRCLGAFAKLRKATISFIVSLRLSRWDKSAPTGRILTKFHMYCSKISPENSGFMKNCVCNIHGNITLRSYDEKHYRENCRENPNKNFIFNNALQKSCRLWKIVEKCGKTGQDKVATLCGACAFHAGYLRLQTYVQNM